MIEWHVSKLEARLRGIQKRLQDALDVSRNDALPVARRRGYIESALEGSIHDIGFTLDLHGDWVKDTPEVGTQEALL